MVSKALPPSHCMAWHNIMSAPKKQRELTCHGRRYEILHTGGFVRLCTPRCRAYWLAQNELMHESADWKIHFSIELDQIPLAWNCIVQLFFERAGEFGLKATTAWEDAHEWPPEQRGREFTIYIFRYDARYGAGPMADARGLTPKERRPFLLNKSHEQSGRYWWAFIWEAEASLSASGVQSCNCADGDLPVGLRGYASIRNEAYVPWRFREDRSIRKCCYPPNEAGWNAAGDPCPLTAFPKWIRRLPAFIKARETEPLAAMRWRRWTLSASSSIAHKRLFLSVLLVAIFTLQLLS
eukprot:gnl/MRDRNA2_/MRDRNA2_102393_c0_seq1.p1 gnl/MRDRNA2_/MRDRNA2_102393_c0~~gnl/MRDRNA2_/MRDRNA2_102393_c0_seq1.p1  ORF type:complete len:295 (+),score=27.41 gnl/MRDRNA2_/MRDRNA2_102393_c0_seq1:96-980(+)